MEDQTTVHKRFDKMFSECVIGTIKITGLLRFDVDKNNDGKLDLYVDIETYSIMDENGVRSSLYGGFLFLGRFDTLELANKYINEIIEIEEQ